MRKPSQLPERSKKFVHRMGQRKRQAHKLHGRPFRCPHCKLRISFTVAMNGKVREVVNFKGDLYLHECDDGTA